MTLIVQRITTEIHYRNYKRECCKCDNCDAFGFTTEDLSEEKREGKNVDIDEESKETDETPFTRSSQLGLKVGGLIILKVLFALTLFYWDLTIKIRLIIYAYPQDSFQRFFNQIVRSWFVGEWTFSPGQFFPD